MKVWKIGLLLFFLLVFFDGSLRKWVAPGLATPLLLLKDGVLLAAFVAYVLNRKTALTLPQPLHRTTVPLLLGLYTFYLLAQALNPTVPNMEIRVLGLRAYVLYMVLLLLLPAAAVHIKRPVRWLKGYMLFVALPILLLGIFQFFQPTTHWVNSYIPGAAVEHIATVGGNVRVIGTFSYIAGMTQFLAFNIALGIGTSLSGLWFRRTDLLCWGGGLLTLSLLVGPMNGSRALFFWLALPLPFVLLQVLKKPGGRMRIIAAGAVGLVLILAVLAYTQLGTGYDAFMHRAATAGDADTRVTSTFRQPLEVLGDAGLFGYGVGTNHQAAAGFMPTDSTVPRIENRIASLVLELGVLGFTLYLLLQGFLLRLAYQVMDRAWYPVEALVGVTAFLYGGSVVTGSLVYEITATALYWFLMGLVLAVWSVQAGRRTSSALSRSARRPMSTG